MGRTLEFYVLKKHMEHDTTREICLNLECEPDDYDLKELLYIHEYGDDDCVNCVGDEKKFTNYLKKTPEEHKEIRKKKDDLIIKYVCGSDEEELNRIWCPKCKIFTQGFYKSHYAIDMRSVSHSYSNPIWESKFNIQNIYLGCFHTDFVKLFRDDKCYRETCKEDIERSYRYIHQYGEPEDEVDKEAYEETLEILDFFKSWSDRNDVILIVEDEI